MNFFKTTDKVSIEIISDVMCPWCIIGYKRLEQAIKDLGVEDSCELIWHPFELNPHMPSEGEPYGEHIKRKYSMNDEQLVKSMQSMKQHFLDLNVPYGCDEKRRIVNTHDAHVLIDYAAREGKQTEVELALFEANFGLCEDVSNHQILLSIAAKLGLDQQSVEIHLDDLYAKKRVQDKEDYWKNQGVSVVPTMIFNKEKILNGAYSVDEYKKVLQGLFNSFKR